MIQRLKIFWFDLARRQITKQSIYILYIYSIMNKFQVDTRIREKAKQTFNC